MTRKLSGTLRNMVLEKTGGHCWYCGMLLSLVETPNQSNHAYACIDHQIPIAHGGMDHYDNLVPACRSCNSSKNTSTVEEYRQRLRCVAVGLAPLSRNQLDWFLARGIDVAAMIEREKPTIIFYGEDED